MLWAYVNYPNPKITAHENPACSAIRKTNKSEQRVIEIALASLSSELGKFVRGEHEFAAEARANDMWLKIDLGDQELEQALLRYVGRQLGKRYAPFSRLRIHFHNCA